MPSRPPRPCVVHGWVLVPYGGGCPECAAQHPPLPASQPDLRPSAAKRGYGYKWQKYREEFFIRPRPCACGCGQLATIENGDIDHIIPVYGAKDPLFWDRANHQAMIHGHHSKKTATKNRVSPRRGRGI